MGMSRYPGAAIIVTLMLVAFLYVAGSCGNAEQTIDKAFRAPEEKALGVKGDYSANGTATFNVPRNLTVTLNGIRLAPGSDLSHEIRMQDVGNKTVVMGELVLVEGEVANVTRQLRDANISETALHNHLLHESPPLMSLHFYAYGDPANITIAISDIIAPLGQGPEVKFDSQGMDTGMLDLIMGKKGKADGGVYGYSIPRADNVTINGIVLSPHMDISTEITFQPTGSGNALVIGEYVLEAKEVEPVISALTDNNIEVDALHNHMLIEQPRLFYLHCWAVGNAEKIASGMREALDRTNSLKGSQ
jgi:hypothetical protein